MRYVTFGMRCLAAALPLAVHQAVAQTSYIPITGLKAHSDTPFHVYIPMFQIGQAKVVRGSFGIYNSFGGKWTDGVPVFYIKPRGCPNWIEVPRSQRVLTTHTEMRLAKTVSFEIALEGSISSSESGELMVLLSGRFDGVAEVSGIKAPYFRRNPFELLLRTQGDNLPGVQVPITNQPTLWASLNPHLNFSDVIFKLSTDFSGWYGNGLKVFTSASEYANPLQKRREWNVSPQAAGRMVTVQLPQEIATDKLVILEVDGVSVAGNAETSILYRRLGDPTTPIAIRRVWNLFRPRFR